MGRELNAIVEDASWSGWDQVLMNRPRKSTKGTGRSQRVELREKSGRVARIFSKNENMFCDRCSFDFDGSRSQTGA